MAVSEQIHHSTSTSAHSRLLAFAFLAIAFETLFSVPYRTLHLATHSAPKAWAAGLVGLLIAAAAFRQRHALWAAIKGRSEHVSALWQSAVVTLAVGAALRLLWVLCFHPPLASDGAGYFTEATNLGQRHFYDSTFWPPGLPLFLAPFIALLGAHYYVSLLCGFLFFVVTVVLTRKVALQITGSCRAAAFGGWVVALWPGHIAMVGVNSKEALIACLFTAIAGLLYGTARWTGRRLWLSMIAIGLLAGYAALTQPGLLLFPSVILLAEWLLTGRWSTALLRTAVAGCGMAGAILPWTIRNYVDYGRVIAISSNGGSVFYRANNPDANASYSGQGEVALPKDTIAADQEGYRMAREWITHHPGAFGVLAVRKQVVFLGDDGDGVYEGLKRNRSPSTPMYAGLKAVTALYWWGLWLALLCCCRRLFRDPKWPAWFAVAFLPFAYQWAIDSVFESGSRHHIAQVGCLALLCAAAFAVLDREASSTPLPQ